MGEAKRRRLAGLPPGPRPDDRRTVRALISRIPYPEATSDPVHGGNARIAWDNAGLVAFGLVALEEADNDGSCALCGRVWKGDDLPAAAVGVVLTGEAEVQTGVRLLCAGCADADQAAVMEAIGRPPRRRPARPPVATRTGGEAERLLREVDQAPGRKLVMADFVALPDLLHDASFGPGVRAALIEAVEEYRGECVLCRRPWTPPDDGGRPERLPAAAVTVKVVRPPAVGEPCGMRYGFVCGDCLEPPDQARAALERMLRTDFVGPDAKELPLLTEAGSA